MNAARLRSTVLPSLVGGTSRHPLPDDNALELLSLLGQAMCFERPVAPDSFIVEPVIKDDRNIIGDRLRRPLIRALTAKNAADHPARALARAFDRLRLRPHPFDLPWIDAFVRSHAERLGPTAQHWADRQKPNAEPRSYFDPEILDESNWTQATPSRRVAYLGQRRQEDANAARSLVESNWSQEDADSRLRLLQVFQTSLSIADHPFLSSLEKDRAPRVRALAVKLLARLGGSNKNPALEACLERIQQGRSGLLRKRATLRIELPANVKDDAAWRWVLQTFADVSFAELAGAFNMAEAELIEAASKDEPLLLALAFIATNERRLDLLELVVAHLPNAWERLYEAGFHSLGPMAEPERRRWVEILVHPQRKDLPGHLALWDWLHRTTDTELPPSVMTMVLEDKLLRNVPEPERGSPLWLELMAATCPASHRQQLREQMMQFDHSQTMTPLALLAILDGMETDEPRV